MFTKYLGTLWSSQVDTQNSLSYSYFKTTQFWFQKESGTEFWFFIFRKYTYDFLIFISHLGGFRSVRELDLYTESTILNWKLLLYNLD